MLLTSLLRYLSETLLFAVDSVSLTGCVYMGVNAKGVDLLVLYPSASVAYIKVRKEVCCRGKLTSPCSLQQGGYNVFQWCFGCNIAKLF